MSLTPHSIVGWVPGTKANVFVANHDTERVRLLPSPSQGTNYSTPKQNGNSLTTKSPSNAYKLATIFSLAFPYGTPTILSSYSFSNASDGGPTGGTYPPSIPIQLLIPSSYTQGHVTPQFDPATKTSRQWGWQMATEAGSANTDILRSRVWSGSAILLARRGRQIGFLLVIRELRLAVVRFLFFSF
jgi:hypothetical protein